MISTLREVREELAAAIGSQVTAYDTLPASPIPPFAVVMWPTSIDFDRTLSGRSEITLPVSVYVPLADVASGQIVLDDLLSGGIHILIDHHDTTVWVAAVVESVTNIRPETLGDAACLAADFNLVIIA